MFTLSAELEIKRLLPAWLHNTLKAPPTTLLIEAPRGSAVGRVSPILNANSNTTSPVIGPLAII